MKRSGTNAAAKLDRKTVERNRRIAMKEHCFKLTSLIPLDNSKSSREMLTQQDQLDLATSYIKQLTEKIEELKTKKQLLLNIESQTIADDRTVNTKDALTLPPCPTKFPVLDVNLKDLGSSLEVNIISGLKKSFMLHQVISIIEEEGAEVLTANFSTVGDRIFYSLHAQVKICRVGVDTTRVYQRLHQLFSASELLNKTRVLQEDSLGGVGRHLFGNYFLP